jgi:hypothetical protein
MNPEEIYKIVNDAINSAIPWWVYFLFIVMPFVGAFIGSYLKKKAENAATKEDIREITVKIETVKSEHKKDLEKFKASLLHRTESKKEFKERKVELLMNYYDNITEFKYEVLAINFGEMPSDTGKSLWEYQQKFFKLITQIIKSYQRLVVYIQPESKILLHADKLTTSVLECRKTNTKYFGRVKFCSIEEHQALMQGDNTSYGKAVANTNKAIKDYNDNINLNIKLFIEYYKKFLTELNEFVKPENKQS